MTKLLLVLLLAAPARAEIMSFGDPTADGIAVSPSTVTVTGTGPGCLQAGTTALYVDCLNKRVGINKNDPTAKLHVSSGTGVFDGSGAGFSVAGPATATFFYGNGSALTGISSSTGTHVDGADGAFRNVTVQSIVSTGTAPSLTAKGAVFTASVTAPTIGGLLPGGLGVTSTLTAGSSVTVDASQLGVGAGATCDGTALLGTDYLLIGNKTCGTSNRSVLRWTGAGSNDTPANSGAASNGDRAVFYNDATGKLAIGAGNSYNMWSQANGVAGSGHEWWGGATNVPSLQMRLASSGNLGIGTASPNAKLDVTGSAMFGTGGTQSTFTATGFFQPYSRTTLQLSLLAPSAVGQYIDNSTLGALCRSTGTSAGNWALATAAGTGCF